MVHNSLFRRRAAVFALGALGTASVAYAFGAAADVTTATTDTSSCYAQLLSLSIAGQGGGTPQAVCSAGTPTSEALLPFVDASPLPLRLHVLYSSAYTRTTGASAEAGVAHVEVPLGDASGNQLPNITADVLTSSATCDSGVAQGESHVARVILGAPVNQTIEVPSNGIPDRIDAGPIHVVMNEVTGASNSGPSTSTTTNTNGDTVTTTGSSGSVTQTALHVFTDADFAIPLDLVIARAHVDCTHAVTTTSPSTSPSASDSASPTASPTPAAAVGWMTGGGQTGTTAVTHSLVLPCTTSQGHPGPKLTVQVPNAGTFRLTSLDSVECSMDPGAGDPEQPDAGFNTIKGTGRGTCNGRKNVDVSFTFTDGGEPNQGRDRDQLTTDAHNAFGCHLDVAGPTTNGNQQAHRGSSPPA